MKRVERAQTGMRIERRLLKVLKAVAEMHDLALGDLVEGIVLHAFEGRCAFDRRSLEKIRGLCEIYELEIGAGDSHRLVESPDPAEDLRE